MTWLTPWRTQTREDLIYAVNEWRKWCVSPVGFRPEFHQTVNHHARYLRQYFRRGPAVRHGSPEEYMHRKYHNS